MNGSAPATRTSTARVITVRGLFVAAALLAVFAVGVVVTVPANGYMISDAVLGVLYLPLPLLGALMVTAQPRNLAGWTLLVGGALFEMKNALDVYAAAGLTMHNPSVPGAAWAGWVSQWGGPGQVAVVSVAVLLFPDGRLPSPAWRRIRPLIAVVLIGLLTQQVAPTLWHWDVASPVHLPKPYGDAISAVSLLSLVLAPVLYTLCAWSVRTRLARLPAADPTRPGVVVVARCAWAAAIAQWVCLFLGGTDLTRLVYVFERVAAVVLAAAAWWAILRYRLIDLRLVVNRALVYGILSGVVAAAYVLVLAAASGLGAREGWTVPALVIGAVVALPLRDVVQRRVNHLVYGQTRDPYAALTDLGDQLAAAAEPESALPDACAALAGSLRLAYVAVDVDGELLASYGTRGPDDPVDEQPLLFAGERIGTLVTSSAATLSVAERTLLERLTTQLAPTARAVGLSVELQRSRERLASLREDERLRIRRDLHDGLGPTLAGIVLGLEQARTRIVANPTSTADTLELLSAHAQAAVVDVRRLVHNLRPPALDELGLPGALAEEARKLGISTAPTDLPSRLPPAVEVALYRIGLEAMTNARRHAGASTVRLSLNCDTDGHVELAVTDDGVGLDPGYRAGIGISSMRERASELGGSCSLIALAPRGTAVIARLPISA